MNLKLYFPKTNNEWWIQHTETTIQNSNSEDIWHIYCTKANVDGIVNINSQSETNIQFVFGMLDTGSNNTGEVLLYWKIFNLELKMVP